MRWSGVDLLRIANSIERPKACNLDGEVEVSAFDGWRVVLFFDCGDLDYIDHFIMPDGTVIDFWEWPDSAERDALIAWR